MTVLGLATVTRAKDGRGGFCAVDRRAWHFVTGLGLNPAVAIPATADGVRRATKLDGAVLQVGSA